MTLYVTDTIDVEAVVAKTGAERKVRKALKYKPHRAIGN